MADVNAVVMWSFCSATAFLGSMTAVKTFEYVVHRNESQMPFFRYKMEQKWWRLPGLTLLDFKYRLPCLFCMHPSITLANNQRYSPLDISLDVFLRSSTRRNNLVEISRPSNRLSGPQEYQIASPSVCAFVRGMNPADGGIVTDIATGGTSGHCSDSDTRSAAQYSGGMPSLDTIYRSIKSRPLANSASLC